METLQKKFELCQRFDSVLNKIDPGYSEIRTFIQVSRVGETPGSILSVPEFFQKKIRCLQDLSTGHCVVRMDSAKLKS